MIFHVPNSFTPDDDMLNQTFKPVFTSGFDPYDFEMIIFNRWGEIVWESNDPSISWDGTYGCKIMQDGIYTWFMECADSENDKRYTFEWHINVLR